MILEQTIKIKWNNKHKAYYESKGYIFTKLYEEFEVDVKDLLPLSKVKVDLQCDYCERKFEMKYCNFIKEHNHACKNCTKIRRKELMLEHFGVDNNMKRPEVVKNGQNTCINKYGVNNPNKIPQVREKIKITSLERYNVEYAVQSLVIQEKIKATCIEKYGVDNPRKNKEIINKIRIKANKTMHENGTATCTKPQKYIYDLLNNIQQCKLNYPVDTLWLDIAYPEEMIYLEYDGGGHDKRVKCGWQTQKEFDKHEINRQYYLKNKGWKLVRIISSNDKLPIDKEIIELIQECKDYLLNSNHSWIKINLNENKIQCKEFEKNFK